MRVSLPCTSPINTQRVPCREVYAVPDNPSTATLVTFAVDTDVGPGPPTPPSELLLLGATWPRPPTVDTVATIPELSNGPRPFETFGCPAPPIYEKTYMLNKKKYTLQENGRLRLDSTLRQHCHHRQAFAQTNLLSASSRPLRARKATKTSSAHATYARDHFDSIGPLCCWCAQNDSTKSTTTPHPLQHHHRRRYHQYLGHFDCCSSTRRHALALPPTITSVSLLHRSVIYLCALSTTTNAHPTLPQRAPPLWPRVVASATTQSHSID